MIVCHSRQFIFISNPKTGSTSIEHALAEFNDEPQLNEVAEAGLYTKRHIPANDLKSKLPASIWSRYFKFAYVRNPWDWFVSQRFYNLAKTGGAVDINAKLTQAQIFETYNFLSSYRGLAKAPSAYQHSFLCDDDNKVLVDFIGRFERIHDDFEFIQGILNTDVSLYHLNSSNHRPYQEYYDDETMTTISDLYRLDIAEFRYTFP